MSFVGQYSEILASGCVGRKRTLGDDYQRSTGTCKCICTCFFLKRLWLDLTMSRYRRDLIKVVYVRKMVKEIGGSWYKEDQHFARAPSQVMKLWKIRSECEIRYDSQHTETFLYTFTNIYPSTSQGADIVYFLQLGGKKSEDAQHSLLLCLRICLYLNQRSFSSDWCC